MKKYTIFLASSAELDEDKQNFELFISKKNKEWHKRGVFLELLTWKDYIDAMSETRLQDEYNKGIRRSDIFVILFHKCIGRYTNEEFEVAYKQFLDSEKKKPLIFTYFKESDEDKSPEIENFKDKIDRLGHFYAVYRNNDDLNYKFSQQLDRLANEGHIKWDSFNWSKSLRYMLFYFVLPVIVLAGVFKLIQLSRPIDLNVQLQEVNQIPGLPFSDGQISLYYGESRTELQVNTGSDISFRDLSSSLRKEDLRLMFSAKHYHPVDTTFRWTGRSIILPVSRDNSLSVVFGTIKDEYNRPVVGASVSIQDITVLTGVDGGFRIDIPRLQQKPQQRLKVYKPGFQLWESSEIYPSTSVENSIVLLK